MKFLENKEFNQILEEMKTLQDNYQNSSVTMKKSYRLDEKEQSIIDAANKKLLEYYEQKIRGLYYKLTQIAGDLVPADFKITPIKERGGTLSDIEKYLEENLKGEPVDYRVDTESNCVVINCLIPHSSLDMFRGYSYHSNIHMEGTISELSLDLLKFSTKKR